ncbi:MAG: hypothetical protein PHS37_07675, partial [Candidatus Omnitrophica bacterium]|nr:hypothetical protein [Candidatus Omnitrophota bacterium]
NLLESLESGDFPISAHLIRALNVDDVDNYSDAKIRIELHLKDYNIDLAGVKAPFFAPDFMKITLLIFLLAIAGMIVRYTVIPYFEVRNRVKNAPPGYWICKKCGTPNPNLSKECAGCTLGSKRFF